MAKTRHGRQEISYYTIKGTEQVIRGNVCVFCVCDLNFGLTFGSRIWSDNNNDVVRYVHIFMFYFIFIFCLHALFVFRKCVDILRWGVVFFTLGLLLLSILIILRFFKMGSYFYP